MKEIDTTHCATGIPGLYIHIPFCRKICPFCSFAVLKDNPARHPTYLNLLHEEYNLLSRQFQLDLTPCESIYLGGGTPSRLSTFELEQLVDWLFSIIKISKKIQWSIEVNPEDISPKYASDLKALGFTRISLGIQSFQQTDLEKLKRVHSGAQSRFALESVIDAGFEDYSLDFMFGFPGQTKEQLEKDIELALSYHPSHISVYSLSIEPKTALNRKPVWKDWIRENENLISDLYRLIVERLTAANFVHYEVSNFCIDGYQSRQNMIYWNRRNYLGLGLGAHSFVSPYRWGNMKRWIDYKSSLTLKSLPHISFEALSETMHRDEEVMLSLRLNQGLDLALFKKKYLLDFPDSWSKKVEAYFQHNLLVEKGNILQLTTKGLLIADEITASLCACLP
ncbi:radical SAM family heme chaperone HemW [bacterium]|nr:radical SAM family heme chaperone HemW [bacterium]